MNRKRYEGFSLIEILVVVALIIILATITIVAINPGKNFRDTRNAQRSSDVNSILNAVTQYTTDGNTLPAGILACDNAGVPQASKIGTGTGNIDLTVLTAGDADYIVSIPMDPNAPDDLGEDTGYTICSIGTRVEIAAPLAEPVGTKVISVRR